MNFSLPTAAKCPPITSLSNGFVRPPQCTAGVSYPGQCHFFCNNAYDLVGPSAISCQNTGSFNINITTISCKKRKCFCCYMFFAVAIVLVVLGRTLFHPENTPFLTFLYMLLLEVFDRVILLLLLFFVVLLLFLPSYRIMMLMMFDLWYC